MDRRILPGSLFSSFLLPPSSAASFWLSSTASDIPEGSVEVSGGLHAGSGGKEVEGGFVTERAVRWNDNPPRPLCSKNIRWGDEEMLRKEAGR